MSIDGTEDGMRVAAERRYNSLHVDAALHSFTSARSENLRTPQIVYARQPKREGTLEGLRKLCPVRLAEMMHEHD